MVRSVYNQGVSTDGQGGLIRNPLGFAVLINYASPSHRAEWLIHIIQFLPSLKLIMY